MSRSAEKRAALTESTKGKTAKGKTKALKGLYEKRAAVLPPFKPYQKPGPGDPIPEEHITEDEEAARAKDREERSTSFRGLSL